MISLKIYPRKNQRRDRTFPFPSQSARNAADLGHPPFSPSPGQVNFEISPGKTLAKGKILLYNKLQFRFHAGVMELVDVVDSKSTGGDTVPVRVRSPAPNQYNPNLFPISDGFGLLLFFDRYESTYFCNGVRHKPTSKPRGPRKKKQAP